MKWKHKEENTQTIMEEKDRKNSNKDQK